MDYLKALRDDSDLAEEFDSLFDFFLLDELSPRDDAEGRCTFSLPGMAFARDGSGGEYHLLEDGSIGYYSSEGEAGRLAESMDDLFSLLVSCICWHDCCDTKQYVDSKTLEESGQRQRNCNLEDMDMDSLQPVSYTHLDVYKRQVQMDNYSDYLLLWSPRDKKLWYLDIEHEEFHPLAKWDDFIADPGRYLNGMIEGEFEE